MSDEETTAFRLIQMNENIKKRRMHYIYILLIWIVTFLFTFLLMLICRFLPDWFPCTLIYVLVFIAAFVFSFYLYLDLAKRDPMDYDRLDLLPPHKMPTVNNSANDYADFVMGSCKGQECCSTGTRWNHKTYRCINAFDLSNALNDLSHNFYDLRDRFNSFINYVPE